MTTTYILGICAGAIVAIVLVVLLKARMRSGVNKILDERQERARGIGYKYGFFTFLILDAAVAFLSLFIDILAANIMIVMFGVIIISVCVYAVYCITNDAYIGLNENPKRTMITLTIIGLMNTAVVVPALIHGTSFISNGEIESWVVNLFCAVMAFFLDGVFYFHQNKISKDED